MNQSNNIGTIAPQNVVYVTTKSLTSTASKIGVYGTPENYEFIKKNIQKMGIITPLIVDVNTNEVISGNLRHKIALELDIKEVPVIFGNYTEGNKKVVSISTNQFRQKTSLEILNEIKFFDEFYNVKKGQRTDLDPHLKEMKAKRDKVLEGVKSPLI